MMKTTVIALFVATALCACGGGSNDDNGFFILDPNTPTPAFSAAVDLGGDTTDPTASSGSSHAFSAPAANLTPVDLATHMTGDGNFEQSFVTAPDPAHPQFDGLGPVNNNNDCNSCHQRDGRGTPPSFSDTFVKLGNNESLFLRISIEDEDTASCIPGINNMYCAPVAVPGFSTQLFQRGQIQVRPDSPGTGQADVYVRYVTSEVQYPDGATVTLRKPVFEIRNPYDSSGEKPGDNVPPVSRLLQDDVKTSPRIGMPVFGIGLLEAISEADILALADADDIDGDGISGRPNYVFDPKKELLGDPDPVSLGRFGWKANTPSNEVQSLGALRGDIGITNFLFPAESIAGTPLHDDYLIRNPDDTGMDAIGNPEADDDFANTVVFYVSTLHVPARRNVDDPGVIRGARLFFAAGCAACHHPSFVTGAHPDGIAELENQTIYPFTDMLLHDMGEGMADGRRDFLATGREWKTRPLWGIGLTQVVNPLTGFLHDGRARSLEEAILWHGGEALQSRERFRKMRQEDRVALLGFLESL
jgi:CxxC motif-containing protein (DUF1111 family)